MSVLVDIAKAVAAELNDPGQPGFCESFEAKRYYQPVFDLGEMQDLHVSVVPKGQAVSKAARAATQNDYQVDVAVQKKLSAGGLDEADALMELVEQIGGFFRLRRLKEYPDAVWVATENEPVFSQEHMDQLRQFTSVLTLTFRACLPADR